MKLKTIISELKKLENRSVKKGYQTDVVDYAIKGHTLELLAIIAKKKIEEDTYAPQKTGKQRFRCKTCEGTGYIEMWDDDKKGIADKVIKDCHDCKGEGYIEIMVIDKRKKTKEKSLYYDDEY